MKNSAIQKLIESNFETVSGHNEILRQVNVEFMWSLGEEYCFYIDVYSQSKFDENKDIITKLDVRLNNSDKTFEGNYCVDSSNVHFMLEQQYIRSSDILKQKIFRSAPGKFTYIVDEGQGDIEHYIDIQIKEISREIF